MTTTIKELIEYLQTLPEDTIISVIDAYDFTSPIEVPLDLKDNVDFCDLSEVAWLKPENKRYNKKFLRLGFI